MRNITIAVLGLCGLMVASGTAQDVTALNYGAIPENANQNMLERSDGLHFGQLQVLPELDLSCFHDSNPTYKAHGEKGVNGLRAEPILGLVLKANEWDIFVRGWYTKDWYIGETAAEKAETETIANGHYGENAGISYKTPQETKIAVTENYDYENGANYAPGAQPGVNAANGDRYTLDLGASLDTKLGEKTGMKLGATYSDLWYANAQYFGWKDEGATLDFSQKVSEKSDVLLTFGVDNQSSEGSTSDSQGYRMLVGFGSQLTAKTSYKAEVGFMAYDFNGGAKTAYAPTYNLSGNWEISERWSAHLSGAADFQPAETDRATYTLVDTITAGVAFKATSRLTTTLDAIYRRQDFSEIEGEPKRIDNEVDLTGRASYQLFRYTSLFVGAAFGRNDSSINTDSESFDYHRLFVEAGIQLHF